MAQAKDLKIISRAGKYCLQIGDDLVRTPGANVIESKTKGLLERVIADFEQDGDLVIEEGIVLEPRVLNAYVLASSERDFFRGGHDIVPELSSGLCNDPIFQPTAGHPIISTYQEQQQEKVRSFLKEHQLFLKVWSRYTEEEQKRVISAILELVSRFSSAQKSALINLSCPCDGQYVMTIMYLLGRCSEREWAMAIFSRTSDVCRLVGDKPVLWGTTGGFDMSVADDLTDEARGELIGSIIQAYEERCLRARRYLDATQEGD